MAGKTYTQKIQFQGSFDGSEVLSGLKKIRQSMSDAGADASLFKGVDKDIAQAEKLITDLLAQIQKGFSNPKEIAAFEKQFEKLGSSLSKINVGLQGVNEVGNFNLNAAEIQKYTKELDKLTAKQGQLEQAARDSIAAQLDAAKLTQKERQAIMDEVEAQGDLEAAIKRVAQAKEKAAKAKQGGKALETQAGKDFISGTDVGLTLDDMGVTAKKGHSKKGRNDARERNDKGKLTGEVDAAKAAAAAQESYQKALEETIKTGGVAADAVEAMKKAMDEYGLELADTSRIQDAFENDLKDFHNQVLTGAQRGAITRASSLGSTDAQGNFNLSQAGQDLVNNTDYQAMRQNAEAAAQAQENINKVTEEGTRQARRFTQETSEGLNRATQSQENLEQATNKTTSEMKEQSEAAQNMDRSFDNMKDAVKTFLSIGSAISAVRNVISQTFNDIKELDKSFANIAMVTDYTVGQMWESYDQYAQMANELGQSTQSVIEASGLFYQQGLDTAESLALTEDTMKLATLAGTDFAEATSQMTAALRGFKMEMDEGARVTDVYSELAAKAAADVQGIAYAMSKTASIAESAGMEFETTSAFLTQMIETTQEAPENIGTAMKTIIARFTELKTNVAGTADSEFDDLDYNKVDTALKSVGVSIKDASGQFRDLDDVFLELSGKWNTLDRNTQRYIATIAAGSRQQSRFIAMMDNYERTMELVDTAYNSAGKSTEQFNKYQDTLEYKLNQLQNTWEQFRIEFFNSSFFKDIIDGLNGILGKITELSGGQLLGLGAAFIVLGKTLVMNLISGAQIGMKKLGELISNKVQSAFNKVGKVQHYQVKVETRKEQIKQLQQKLAELKNQKIEFESDNKDVLDDLKKIQEEIRKAKEAGENLEFGQAAERAGFDPTSDQTRIDDAQAMQNLQNEQDARIAAAENNINVQQDILGDEEAQLTDAQQRGQILGQTLATSMSAAIVAVTTQDNPMAAIGTVLVTGISGIIPMVVTEIIKAGGIFTTAFWTSTAGIGVIVSTVVAIIAGVAVLGKNLYEDYEANKFENRFKEAKKAAEEAEKAAEEASAAAKEAQESLESATSLQERFNELNEKQVLTNAEQAEYNELVSQIQDQFPEIISYYNEVTGELRVQNELWDEIIAKQKAEAEQASRDLWQANQSATATKSHLKTYELVSDYSNKTNFKGETLEEKVIYNEDFNIDSAMTEISEGLAEGVTIDYTKDGSYISNNPLTELGFDLDALAEEYETINRDNYSSSVEGTAEYYQAIVDALENDTEQIRENLIGLKQSQEDNLKAEYDMIADNFGQTIAAIDTDAGEGEIALAEALGEVAISNAGLESMTYDEYKKKVGDNFDQNNNFFDALGGAWKGASDNSFSDWEDLDTDMNIDDEGVLDAYGIVDVGDVKEKFLAAYGDDEAAAAEKWAEWQGDAAGQMKIFETVVNQAIYEHMKEARSAKELSEAENELLETYYAEALEGGTTQAEIVQLTEFLRDAGFSTDEINAFLEDIQTAYNDAVNKATEIGGIDETVVADWSTDQMNRYTSVIEGIDESIREEYAKGLNDFITSNALTADQVGVLLSLDIDSLNMLNIEETKEQYIEDLVEMEMTTEEAEQAWEEYIDTVSKYGTNLAITSTVGVEDFISKVEELRTTAIEAWDEISSAQEEYFKEGQIGLKTVQSLIKAGYGDYISQSTNGMILSQESLMDAYFDSVTSGGESLEKQIEQNETSYQANDLRKSSLQTKINALEEKETLTTEEQATLDEYNAELIELEGLLDGIVAAREEMEAQQPFQDMLDVLAVSEATKEFADAVKAAEDAEAKAEKTYNDADEKLADLEQAYYDAEKAAQEARYGTEDFKSSLDGLINYDKPLERLSQRLEETKNALNKVNSIDEAKDILSNTTSLYENKLATQQAKGRVLEQSRANLQQELLANYGDYVSFDEFGSLQIDFSYQDMNDSDVIKTEGLEALVEEYQSVDDMYHEGKKESIETEEEYNELLKQAREGQIAIEEKVIDILKEQMQEEVDAVKDKYEALEEADNNYLDALQEAIDKQRELRDQENQYEDLATKEKKLALMQRDTSGANQKDVQKLEKEIEDDRQNLLDNEIDNLIDSMKELYEKQKEARDLEIEAMEAATENMQLINETALNIISGFTNVEDYQSWLLQNDPSIQEMTTAQTEQYLEEAKETFAGYAQYVASTTQDVTLKANEINQKSDEVFTNTSENISTIGTTIQEAAEKAKQDAIDAADDAVEEAKKAWDEGKLNAENAYKDWKTAEENLEKSRQDNIAATESALKRLTEMAKTESILAAQTAINTMLDLGKTPEELVKEYGIAQELVDATVAGEEYTGVTSYDVQIINPSTGEGEFMGLSFSTLEAAQAYADYYAKQKNNTIGTQVEAISSGSDLRSESQKHSFIGEHGIIWSDGEYSKYNSQEEALAAIERWKKYTDINSSDEAGKHEDAVNGTYFAFKKGGLVDYTGPAWVDGTPQKPESFLNSEDTARIGAAAKLLADLPIFNKTSNAENAVATNIGDTSIEIHINVESISDDYDVDQMIERVKHDIVDVAKPIGTSVILNK